MVDDAGGSRARAAGLALGITFLAVGILGFILNPTGGALLGVFAVNAVHNLVQVLFGILGLAVAYAGWSRPYCQGVGAIYLLLGVSIAGCSGVEPSPSWAHQRLRGLPSEDHASQMRMGQ